MKLNTRWASHKCSLSLPCWRKLESGSISGSQWESKAITGIPWIWQDGWKQGWMGWRGDLGGGLEQLRHVLQCNTRLLLSCRPVCLCWQTVMACSVRGEGSKLYCTMTVNMKACFTQLAEAFIWYVGWEVSAVYTLICKSDPGEARVWLTDPLMHRWSFAAKRHALNFWHKPTSQLNTCAGLPVWNSRLSI